MNVCAWCIVVGVSREAGAEQGKEDLDNGSMSFDGCAREASPSQQETV